LEGFFAKSLLISPQARDLPVDAGSRCFPRAQAKVIQNMNDNRPWLGLVLVALAAVSYAANSSFSVVAYSGGATPLSMVSFRVTFTVISLYALLRLMSVSLVMTPRDRNISLALGILLAAYSYCLMEAFDRLPVALAVITFYLYPLFMGITAYVIGQDRLSRALVIGLIAAFVGLAVALDVTGESLDPLGIALAAAAAATFTAVAVIAAPIVKRHGDPRPLVLYSHATCAVIMITISLIVWEFPLPTTTRTLIAFVAVPVFYTVAAVAFFAAVTRIGTVRTGLLMNLEPIAAMVFGFTILDQILTPIQVAGAVVVIAAATAVKWDSGRLQTEA
jgi:drug/metabolite transporter (DMT)-like permease